MTDTVKTWSTACPNWESRIIAGESLIAFPPLFPAEADAGLSVFNELRLVDVLGRPTMGQVARPWLIDFAASIFGAYDQESGRRLITEFFLLVSKKNSKSTTAASIMLTCLIRNWRDSAEFLILAPTVEIAQNSFLPARDMVRADEELSDLMYVQEHYRQITHRNTGATLKVVAADNETVGGKKATGILLDECWLFGKRPNAENMLREACGGLASRPEGFIIWLSTQSDEAPAGVFKQKLDYARGVRDGRIDDNRFLPVIYEYPDAILKGKTYLDPKMFYVTNPNLGASVDEEFLAREFKKAEEAGAESMQGFLAKHLNVEMGLALKSQRWAGADFWEAASGTVSLDLILERCEVIVMGVDGGGLDDLLGVTVLGRVSSDYDDPSLETEPFRHLYIQETLDDDGNVIDSQLIEKIGAVGKGAWLWWSHAWCHAIALERRKSEAPKYHDFAADGDLTIVDDIGEDVKQLGDIVRKCDASGLLDRIGVDPAGIGAIVDELEQGDENGEGKIDHDRIVGIPQGWRMNSAIKTTERKVAAKEIIHAGSRMMSWCVGNARVEPKGNAILITKQASGTGKIDPLMAGLNAVALMGMNPEAKNPRSVYEGLTREQMIARMTGQ
jgi:phage terminase large subunit-like protein